MSPPCRVAFDVTPVISGRTGIARYTAQIQAALAAEPVDLHPFAVGRSTFPAPPGTRHVRLPARALDTWWAACPRPYLEQFVGSADLVHATGLFLPSTRLPLVVTVHDLGALRHPELHPARQLRQQRALLRKLRQAAAILAVSAAATEDLVAFGIDRERVVVAPLGLTPLPSPAGDQEAPAGQAPYVLTVGETAARKDYGIVIEALARLPEELNLVMVGPPGADEPRLLRLAANLGIAPRVRRLGAVSDQALAGLYRGALALCFPSVIEGFGLPVLEAMASGTPVLASDIPATRELAGRAARYIEQRRADAWAQAIDELAGDAALRSALAESGRRRAAQFSWERTARATAEAYRVALASAAGAGS